MEANELTVLRLERNRLSLLENTLPLKRPVQRLRANGLMGLPEKDRMELLQWVETKANIRAIQLKKIEIKKVRAKLKVMKDVKLEPDNQLLDYHKEKLNNKLKFLKSCDNTKFKSWQPKKTSHPAGSINGFIGAMRKKVDRKNKRKEKRKLKKDQKKRDSLILRSKEAIENNHVVNLTDIDIPDYSIAVLGYGPGWIPTPSYDSLQYRIDGHNVANKLAWQSLLQSSATSPNSDLPANLLKKTLTSICTEVKDPVIGQIKSEINNFVENSNPPGLMSNLNRYEREGLSWLMNAVKENLVAITKADKGGSLIISTPDKIREITGEKLMNPEQYEPILNLDTPNILRAKMLDLWKKGVSAGFVSKDQARKIVGLIYDTKGKVTLSTNDLYRPGITYGYPLLKLHKLTLQQIKDKIYPPSRFVSNLSNSFTARQDKFLA